MTDSEAVCATFVTCDEPGCQREAVTRFCEYHDQPCPRCFGDRYVMSGPDYDHEAIIGPPELVPCPLCNEEP